MCQVSWSTLVWNESRIGAPQPAQRQPSVPARHGGGTQGLTTTKKIPSEMGRTGRTGPRAESEAATLKQLQINKENGNKESGGGSTLRINDPPEHITGNGPHLPAPPSTFLRASRRYSDSLTEISCSERSGAEEAELKAVMRRFPTSVPPRRQTPKPRQ